MKLLHLIDSLDYSGSARQLHLLGPVLAHSGLTLEICCLGPDTSWAAQLRRAGIVVNALGWKRWFDPSVLWNLREILARAKPDLVHVWRVPALRALTTVASDLLPRVVMSAPLPTRGRLAWWDRWLLQQVRCLAVAGVSDQHRCRQEGLSVPALVVPPAAPAEELTRREAAPQATNSIVCVGNLERAEGFRLAVWAFDILRELYPDSRLRLIGAGSQRADLEALSRGLESIRQVEFLGAQTDVSAALRDADVVWIPSTANCGRQVALEAMAHGRVVIASEVPCLRDVVVEGETGYLVPIGDVVQFGRRTHQLFRDADLRARLGQSARRHVEQRFSLADAAERWGEVYRSVAA